MNGNFEAMKINVAGSDFNKPEKLGSSMETAMRALEDCLGRVDASDFEKALEA